MTTDVSLTQAAVNAQKTSQAGIGLAKDFTQFLTLLTTQLQNQDPLNPMDSSEFTNQLVQFSQVEQAINTNQKLDSLVSLQLAGMHGAALSYVGMDITYVSADMNYDGSTPIDIHYGLAENASVSKMNVFDDEGNLVYTAEAPGTAGSNKMTWDGTLTDGGKAGPGTYSVRIDALNSEGNPISVTTAVTGRVRGIESQDGIIFLLVGERAITLGNVINATVPQTATAPPPDGTDTGTDTGTENNNENEQESTS